MDLRNVFLSILILSVVLLSACSAPATAQPIPSQNPTITQPPMPTSTSTPLPIEIVDNKGASMRLVPVGDFTMGSDVVFDESVHTVQLDAYYIDTYEVTNAQYKVCADEGICKPPDMESFGYSNYYGNPVFDEFPVMLVDWNMASEYCAWRAAQLPTEAQWEKAALGTDRRTYPWGEGIDCSKANYRLHCGVDRIETTAVGSFKDDMSPYGLYDMAGNVKEWVRDWYDASYFQNSPRSNPSGPDLGTDRVFRGGSFFSEVRIFSRSPQKPTYISYDLGFRCASQASQ